MELKDLQEKIAQMESSSQRSTVDLQSVEQTMPLLMRKVYLWMTFALIITGVVAYSMNSITIYSESGEIVPLSWALMSNSLLRWTVILAPVGLVWFLGSRIMSISLGTATALFILYSILTGMMLSALLAVFTGESVAMVFFITAGMFCTMSFIGMTTRRSLQGMGRYLIMALVGLLIALLVNWFLQSGTMSLIISVVGVILFTALTAYDTQKIKLMLAMQDDMEEAAHKVALLGALTLYLDFINLFIYLLRLLGSRK